jgi:hypothetical protein
MIDLRFAAHSVVPVDPSKELPVSVPVDLWKRFQDFIERDTAIAADLRNASLPCCEPLRLVKLLQVKLGPQRQSFF